MESWFLILPMGVLAMHGHWVVVYKCLILPLFACMAPCIASKLVEAFKKQRFGRIKWEGNGTEVAAASCPWNFMEAKATTFYMNDYRITFI